MEIQNIRVRNLKEFVYLQGGAAPLSRKYDGIDASYVSQLMNGHRSFGEKAARKIEEICNLPKNYFDKTISLLESDDIRKPEINWYKRLNTAIKDRNISLDKLSVILNIQRQNLDLMLSGNTENLNEKLILNLCNYLDVTPSWLFFNKIPTDSLVTHKEINILNNNEYPAIKRVNLKLSAGIVGYSIDYDVEDKTPIVMQKEWFKNRGYKPSFLLATKVKGDSMQPGLYDGDTVVINTSDNHPSDGDVFAINYEGEMLIKRIQRDNGLWWLTSDNPDQRKFPRKECSSDLCIIIGKVVHKQSEVI